MSGLVFNSLVGLACSVAILPASPQGREKPAGKMPTLQPVAGVNASRRAADPVGPAMLTFVEPSKDSLVVELGRSRLLRFPAGIRRTALSNTDSSDIVPVAPGEVLVLGRHQGVANLTVWPADPQAAPAVIVVRVERQLRRDE